jgi:protein-disulfide isomerase
MAAETAEFAGAHDKFWQMHDLLFENQNYLSMELILSLIESLKLPLDEFNAAISNRIYLPKIKEDFMGGVKSGVNGTPTFFINGERHNGSFEDLPYVLQQLI